MTRTEYDELNRPVRVTVNYVQGGPLDQETNLTTLYGYDDAGNRIQITDPVSRITRYEYDELNRPVRVIANYVDGVYDPTHPDEDVATAYAYDEVGNRIQTSNLQSQISKYEYDALNRLTGVVENDVDGGPVDQATNVHTVYGYDAVGNRTSVTDANGHAMTYEYDDLNRLVTVSDPLGHSTSYGYDAVGNRVSMTDANGFTTFYSYDDVNRLVRLDYPDPDPDVTFAYDPVGNRVAMTDATGTTHYDYDPAYRLAMIHDSHFTVQYAYDAAGNRTGLIYPDTKTVHYTYDDANRLETVTDWESQVVTYTGLRKK